MAAHHYKYIVSQDHPLVMTLKHFSNDDNTQIVVMGKQAHNKDYQLWYHKDDSYIIAMATADNRAVTNEVTTPANGNRIFNRTKTGAQNQKWNIVPTDAGAVYITPELDNNLALTLKDGNPQEGTEVILTPILDSGIPTGSQLWKFDHK
ncbi:uncharacterized protein LOC118419981 [Branchiostoma floridae]|uniref:Uncharacterized protein LOC118419981 n=1 Tax=Branchiostoma floridae TaxID=7739 RepID=C3Y3D9_BRAFL|nr:uncharacterized protein LOC118419981 [Branchiostoma floridae]XP_035682578.1 uncharacterized protein LOC118419981 [Branchiostoma floridae]|eukprot:XP_002609196.1 hypothetical protein BRAFLDRAFT_90649 [Branchiostoma floridae]